jgi:hypothetical protein
VLVAGWTHTADPRLRLGLATWGRALDASGHVVFAEKPDELARLIRDFLVGDAG